MATVSLRRGRPNRFSNSEVRTVKSVCRQYGLRGGQVELANRGIVVSLPTLAKYIKSEMGGTKPVKTKRGRRKAA